MIVSDEQFLDLSAFVWNDRPKIQRHHVNIDGSKSQVYEVTNIYKDFDRARNCLLYTSPSPRDVEESRMPSSA